MAIFLSLYSDFDQLLACVMKTLIVWILYLLAHVQRVLTKSPLVNTRKKIACGNRIIGALAVSRRNNRNSYCIFSACSFSGQYFRSTPWIDHCFGRRY